MDLITPEQLEKSEILRYLGHTNQQVPEDISMLIDDSITEALQVIRPTYTYGVYPVILRDESVSLGTSVVELQGKSIYEHLFGAELCIVFAATLGIEMERLLQLTKHRNMTKMVILDAVANEIIEKYCDMIEQELLGQKKLQGYYSNFRFSPGYGDLPMETQPQILQLLQTDKRMGLTCNQNNIMIPRKSVTAIIGLFVDEQQKDKALPCEICQLRETCENRKRGVFCGAKK